MAVVKKTSARLGIILVCLLAGTWLGIFLQRIDALSSLFANFLDFTVNVNEIDFVMIRFGFLFGMKINLGTVIGAFAGLWATR